MEDTVLHLKFDYVVWLMLVITKKKKNGSFLYSLTTKDVDILMSIVFEIGNTKLRDNYGIFFADSNKKNNLNFNQPSKTFKNPLLNKAGTDFNNELDHLPEKRRKKIRSLISALLIRANYGGMPFDIQMLKNFSLLWFTRFKNDCETWFSFLSDSRIAPKFNWKPEPNRHYYLFKNERVCYAIDHHSYPYLINKLVEFFPSDISIDPETVKSAIWNHASGINTRKSFCIPSAPLDLNRNGFEDLYTKREQSKTIEVWNKIQKRWIILTSSDYFWKLQKPDPIPAKKRKRDDNKTPNQPKKKKKKIISSKGNQKISSFFKRIVKKKK